eukprot:6176768-Pleurochrysis_carterae.AAC.2
MMRSVVLLYRLDSAAPPNNRRGGARPTKIMSLPNAANVRGDYGCVSHGMRNLTSVAETLTVVKFEDIVITRSLRSRSSPGSLSSTYRAPGEFSHTGYSDGVLTGIFTVHARYSVMKAR